MNEQNQDIQRLLAIIRANHTPEELAIGYLRYECVRRLSPRTFTELYKRNLAGDATFDELIDEAAADWKRMGIKPVVERAIEQLNAK